MKNKDRVKKRILKTVGQDKEVDFLSLGEIKGGLVESRDFKKVIKERKKIFNYEKKLFVPEVIGKELHEDKNHLNEGRQKDEITLGKETIVLKGISGLRKMVWLVRLNS